MLNGSDITRVSSYDSDSWKVICSAIQTCFFGNPVFAPLETDWETIFQESKNQAITVIVRAGLKGKLPEVIDNSWKKYDYVNTFHFVKVLDAQKDLNDLLKKSNIPFVILKGTAAAIYYPSPELRIMGDIDFYVPAHCFDHALKLLIENKYLLGDDDSRHVKLYKNDVEFEMHHRFSYQYDSYNIDLYIDQGIKNLKTGVVRNRSFPMLPDLENGLVLLVHLRDHLMVGIGLRQILDWMMYANRVLSDDYWASKFEPEVKKLALRTLAITVTRMCQIYFGLSDSITWCSEADEQLCKRLMLNIIHSGNFGFIHGSGINVEKTLINFKRKGFFQYLQKAGEYNWKAYHKYHWLKPFSWLYQIFRYIRQGLFMNRSEGTIVDDYIRSMDRHNLLKDLDCI